MAPGEGGDSHRVVGVVVDPIRPEGESEITEYPHRDTDDEGANDVCPTGDGDVVAHVGDAGAPVLEVEGRGDYYIVAEEDCDVHQRDLVWCQQSYSP